MVDKKKIDESATLTINTTEGDVDGSLTINAADSTELSQIIKRAGLDKTHAQGSATLSITSPDGKMSTNINSANIRSILDLLHCDDSTEISTVIPDETMAENAEANDYASELSSRKGEVYSGSTSRPGTARADTHLIPAKSGDNPLAEWGLKSFKDYLGEFTEHVYPKKGDLRPVLYSKYRGDEYSGWGVEQYNTTKYGGDWDMPDWFHDEPSLAGPFSSSRDALDAIHAYWSNQENLDESNQSGKYRDTLCLSFGTDGEADYVELDVSFTYTVQWGSPEVGRSYMGDPAAYDPGSPSVIEDIAIVAIDGVDPMKYGADTVDVVLDELNSGKHDEHLLANASDQEESRRPDESLEEAPSWKERESRYGESMILLPAEHNVTLDTLDQTYFDPGSYVYVVGKENSKGAYTPRLCISSGKLNYTDGQNVTVVHDQNRGITPGRVLFQFSYNDWIDDRESLAKAFENLGISRNKKIPVKVFK